MSIPESQSLKSQLFRCYASNLTAYCPELEGVFACPLCGRFFAQDALDTKDVTKEHIIPERLGGREVTLSCRDCNVRDGSLLDAHLVQRIAMEDIGAGVSDEPLRARVHIEGAEFGADIFDFAKSGPMRIYAIPKISDRKQYQAAFDTLAKGGGVAGRIDVPLRFKRLNSLVAVLRAAYLQMFRYFGYGYVLHPAVEQVRHQILNPQEDTVASRAVLPLSQPPPEVQCVSILHSPRELQCFLVTFDLSSGSDRYWAVVLPGLDDQSEHVYDVWLTPPPKRLDFTARLIPFDRDVVCNPKNAWLPSYLWRRVTSGSARSSTPSRE